MSQRILGLDVGKSRVGIAVSDPLGLFAQPLDTFDTESSISRIAQLVAQKDIKIIVIGLPVEMSGVEGEQAQWVRTYAEKLRASLPESDDEKIRIELWDERLSSVEAERVIRGSKLKSRERRAAVDRVAAAIILESFINSTRNSSQ